MTPRCTRQILTEGKGLWSRMGSVTGGWAGNSLALPRAWIYSCDKRDIPTRQFSGLGHVCPQGSILGLIWKGGAGSIGG